MEKRIIPRLFGSDTHHVFDRFREIYFMRSTATKLHTHSTRPYLHKTLLLHREAGMRREKIRHIQEGLVYV